MLHVPKPVMTYHTTAITAQRYGTTLVAAGTQGPVGAHGASVLDRLVIEEVSSGFLIFFCYFITIFFLF